MLPTLCFVIGLSSMIFFLSSSFISFPFIINDNHFDRQEKIENDLTIPIQNFSFSPSFYDFIKLTSNHVLNKHKKININQEKYINIELPTIKEEKKNKNKQSNSYFPFYSSSTSSVSSMTTSPSQYPHPTSVTNFGFFVWSWSSIHNKNDFHDPFLQASSSLSSSTSTHESQKQTMPIVQESILPPVDILENQTEKEKSKTSIESFEVENVLHDILNLENNIKLMFIKQKKMEQTFIYNYKILLHCFVFVSMILITFVMYFFSYFYFYHSSSFSSSQNFSFTSKQYNFNLTPSNSLKCIDY